MRQYLKARVYMQPHGSLRGPPQVWRLLYLRAEPEGGWTSQGPEDGFVWGTDTPFSLFRGSPRPGRFPGRVTEAFVVLSLRPGLPPEIPSGPRIFSEPRMAGRVVAVGFKYFSPKSESIWTLIFCSIDRFAL